jgi:pathogenesis-related protein 1
MWFIIPGIVATDLARTTRKDAAVARHGKISTGHPILGHLVTDHEPTVLDFSNMPFSDSMVNLANSDPYKDNPKNGTPWFRYTKTAGRGQANHSHFGGLSATGDFPEDILHAHNVVRERAGVEPLLWDTKLAEMSSARALKLANEGCYIEHSPLKDRWYEAGFEYVGENLYKVINMKPTGVDIVDAWYAELEDYSFGLVGSQCVKGRCAGRASPPCTLGHFTQVMWAKSKAVGCARAECPDQAKRTFISVCNYGEGGNIVGQYPFPAVNAGKLGLGMHDCTMKPRPEPSAWDDVKHGKLPTHFRSGAWQQLRSTALGVAMFASIVSMCA